ncbi:uncharacterized protein [Sinocyclocheilus grahami]|uniref:uncharacterized protein n=1 Tax=Sinocyclocheilus grahami TaxID=75366 RepID=UPI0007AD3A83|nr:PREDICTED: uncharacterized protein LOC107561198 [Sinocyclocheilus grahami]
MLSTEDYGYYSCRQYVNGEQQGPDAHVYLHVLHVSSSSSSSSQTEISAGRSVTLFCQLYSFAGGSCVDWIGSERIQLFWVNQAGVKLMRSDSRYQILSSSHHCIITLNTTLLNEDHNREWRCNVTQRDQVKSSVTYTVKSSAQADSATAVTPVHSTHSEDPSTTNTHVTKDPAETEVCRTDGSLFREKCRKMVSTLHVLNECDSIGFHEKTTVFTYERLYRREE